MYAIKSCTTINFVVSFLSCSGYEYFSLNNVNNVISSIREVNLNQNNDRETDMISEDANLNVTQLVNKYGYSIEEHTVVTEDGYILSLQRIPRDKNSTKNNPSILLMHGILDSSDSWVLQGPYNALAYTLHDEGFDVWMGNARGNKYSSSHITLDVRKSDFWKFSWEEIGIYDLPAMIDYVLNFTKTEHLYYIGHSQGTTVFYVMTSLKPEYNAKVKIMFALAPITWLSHAKSPVIKLFTPVYGILGYFTSSINTYSSSTDIFSSVPKLFCNVLRISCGNILQWITGNDYKLIEPSLMPVIYRHFPSSSSILQFIHYGQLFQSGRFARFDYGSSENCLKYGQSAPPDYDLSNVTVPVVLFYSSNDWLSDVADVAQLFNKLPNVYDSYNIDYFNHADYMHANVAKELIYLNIVKIINEFELSED